MKIAILLTLIFIFQKLIFAGPGNIKGIVMDKTSGDPLPGANITVDKINLGAAADSNGFFIISGIPAGSYNFTSSMIGYLTQSKKISISSNDTAYIIFKLDPSVLSLSEIVVEGERDYTASSSLALNKFDFELRSRQSSQDMLKLVPGLFIAQHAGGGKAEQIFLRGFDADHGTDVDISVDDLPVNMVSHAHGQGYSDLHFVIPETINELDVQKGPYFLENGDFSTAGSVKFKTLDSLSNNVYSLEGGSFGTYRTLLMSQIPTGTSNIYAYAAGEYFWTNGYFDSPSDFDRYNFFGKMIDKIDDDKSLVISASNYGAKWNASGQIPERAVSEGLIDRFGSLDNSEGGATGRTNLNLIYNSIVKDESEFNINAYLFNYNFKLFSDFTFFLTDTVNGDEIEQDDYRTALGFNSTYSINNKIQGIDSKTIFGMYLRNDKADVELWHDVKRIRLNPDADALVNESSTGIYAGEDVVLNTKLKFNFGLRSDFFYFDLRDLLKDTTNLSGNVEKLNLSPKLNIVYSPGSTLDLFYNFGSSFHSNDARVVVSHPDQRTLPRATGMEIGSRLKTSNNSLLSLTLWGLDLQNEYVYNGDEGTYDIEGATRRIGIDASLRDQILPWLWADLDINLCRGRFKYYPVGQNYIPLAPSRTSTGGLTCRFTDGIEGSIRYRSMDGRPATEDNTVRASGYTVFESYLSYNISSYKITLSVDNLFNVNWDEAQFDTETRLKNETEPVSEIDFTPGTPRCIKTAITYSF
jgi:hypothetical protein